MARSLFPKLADGEYVAKCKEKSALSAAVNGHSQIWPEAKVIVKEGNARFYKDGRLVWECNATYAHHNFEVASAPAKGK